ncbi:ABC transporter ATP-binding protein [Acuticoccus yangtzensis]|uniref:ABC transporter ATP-binding protein n=1 Tax=Acuticoccus yangtzensis TaxID=1443441 RepID=UPI0009499937|nr:ABC transporter ATP-binding protein [Acuticoccus yangtzensis]ORE91216.1 branched-chain amino acid ABC transporter ATPase [Stappia sp. 22II-S9-Z10]
MADAATLARPGTATGTAPFFSCRDVHAYYGESYIVQGVSFEVMEGEVIALLGRNGAGKTSTLRTIARTDTPQMRSGEIWLGGTALHKTNAVGAAQAGLQLVPEDRRIIAGLTVEENLKLAQIAEPIGWPIEKVYERFPRLAERRRQEAVTMSGGEQQMLAVARALCRELKLLLLDEPYEGLAPVIVQEIERCVAEIKAAGITTIMVEQNAIAALHLADRAIIMDMGEIVYTGTAADVLADKALREEYLAV